MVQPIHYLHFKHQTCRTVKGKRRSPVQGISYDSDMMLLDKTTGKAIYRKHSDGTMVIYSEIFSSPSCKYGDTSVPLNERRTEMWNELYAKNKNNNERIRAYCEIAIPNFLTDEEMIELAKKIGMHFATTFKRPCDLSVHKKPGNNHIHISLPEREFTDGKFQDKRKRIYKDFAGNLLYNKEYKDKKGLDIRKPIIDYDKVKKENEKRKNEGNNEEVDPFDRNENTGIYTFQKTDERNRKQWENDSKIGKWLEKEELSQAHDDVDRIINGYLKELGYDVTVKRNDKRIIKILKENNLQQIRVPERDYKTNSNRKLEIDAENSRRRFIQGKLERNLAKRDTLEKEISAKTNQKLKISESIATLAREIANNKKELIVAEQLENDAIQKNINSNLRPVEATDLEINLKTNEELENSHITGNPIEEKFKNEWKIKPYMATVHLYNATRRNEIEYSIEKRNLINQEREKALDLLLGKIIYTVPYKELENDTKQKDPKEIKIYYKKHSKKLESISKNYGLFEEYIEYKRWSDINSHYYNLGQNHNIKDSSERSGRQIENINRNERES